MGPKRFHFIDYFAFPQRQWLVTLPRSLTFKPKHGTLEMEIPFGTIILWRVISLWFYDSDDIEVKSQKGFFGKDVDKQELALKSVMLIPGGLLLPPYFTHIICCYSLLHSYSVHIPPANST